MAYAACGEDFATSDRLLMAVVQREIFEVMNSLIKSRLPKGEPR